MNKHEEILALSEKLTPRRQEFFKDVISRRTRHFTMVCEDLFDPHNISAIIRTAEVYGFQDVHIIEEINPYRVAKSVLKGSFKWLSLYRYQQREACYKNLRKQGYQIAVASTNATKTIAEVDLSKPTAFYMGTEFKGNNPETLSQADVEFILPQYGVTESMNVSVAAGVLMTYADIFLQRKGRDAYTISGEEKEELLFNWYERSAFGIEKNSPLIDITLDNLI
jgi:tRNA (guanosine-2'-O-)-methyltransferase